MKQSTAETLGALIGLAAMMTFWIFAVVMHAAAFGFGLFLAYKVFSLLTGV